ncbi:MAG: nitroreductase family protein [Planctomycetota bacterium]
MSNPPAATDYPVLDCLADRWSPRSFADTPVETEQLRQLFEAARWAASAFNEQPWRFIVATKENRESYERVLSCLVEANQAWARSAPVLGITAVSETFAKNDKPNRCAEHDLGLAMGNLSAQATALGLMIHQMAGIDQNRAKDVLQIPDGFHAFSGFALGHLGPADALPEGWMRDAETAPRPRNPFDEFVFGEAFGQPTQWFHG